MERLSEFWARVVAWIRRGSVDRDFSDELSAHVDLAVADEVMRGADPRKARRLALLKIGGIDQARELHRDFRGLPRVDSLGRDVRDGIRLLRRTPGFTIAAVLSLAIGIGANTAIFSILNSLVLRPLPVREPSRLVELLSGPGENAWTYPLSREIQARPRLFDGVAAWGSPALTPFKLIEGGELESVAVYTVNGDFFGVLGVRPARGRLLTPADDVRGGPAGGPTAVISDAFWRSHFGASETAVGTVLTLDRARVTIVGVTPPGFLGPEAGQSFDIIAPIALLSKGLLDQRGFFWISLMARLKPYQTPEAAGQALRAVQQEMRTATLPTGLRPEQAREYLSEPVDVRASATGPSSVRTKYRDPLLVIMTAVGLVLLMACTNIANLLLARGEARQHEFSLRLALGASRGRLIRQLLIESLILAVAGAAAGLLIATWGSRVLVNQLSTSTNQVSLPLPLDWRVLGFTAAATIITAFLFGLLPALRAGRVEPRAALAERSRAIVGGRARSWLGRGLVVSQVALSLVLAFGAGLLVRTFTSLTTADLGFDPRPVLITSLRPRPGATLGASSDARLDRALEVVRTTPGVTAAAFSGFTTPMSGLRHDDLLQNPAGFSLTESQRRVFFRDVGAGWFKVMGMRFVQGQDFSDIDTPHADTVAVINETLATRFFPDHNPIGQTLREAGPPGGAAPAWTIVGVVADAVYNSAREGVLPGLYRFQLRSSVIVVRAAHGDAVAVARDVSHAITQNDPAFLTATKPMAEQVRDTLSRERLLAVLSSIFGGMALLLAGTGVYGVIAYGVGRRRSEIAVRRALGATPFVITRLVLSGTLRLISGGASVGILASLWLMRFLTPLLYGLGPRDPLTLTLATLALVVVGILAGLMPAQRASRIDPASVLRES